MGELTQYEKQLQFEEKVENFKWRDRHGHYHDPKEMHTRHLFFTLRMIWNHAVPEQYRITPYTRYTFDPEIYTVGYFLLALSALTNELKTRGEEVTPYLPQLKVMKDYYIHAFKHVIEGGE